MSVSFLARKSISSNAKPRMTEPTILVFCLLFDHRETGGAADGEARRGRAGISQQQNKSCQAAGFEVLEDHQRDDTCHTTGNDDYTSLDAGTRLRQLHQRAHTTAQPTGRMEEPFTDRHCTDTVVRCLTEEYRGVNLMTWQHPDVDIPELNSVLRHLYMDGPSRNETGRIAGHGVRP